MGKRYRELLEDIFKRKILCDDFFALRPLPRPTATDPSFAPDGCDSFLCPGAGSQSARREVDWETEGPKLRNRIVKALGETLLPDLEECITSDFFMTPEDFHHDYLSHAGAGFSIAPYFTQSAWFRFHNLAEGGRRPLPDRRGHPSGAPECQAFCVRRKRWKSWFPIPPARIDVQNNPGKEKGRRGACLSQDVLAGPCAVRWPRQAFRQ